MKPWTTQEPSELVFVVFREDCHMYLSVFFFSDNLYMVTNPGFEYDNTPSYSINFVCTDSNGEASTAMTLTVNILPNTPPTISGLPTSVSVNDGEDGPLKIYDITVTDAESDSFTCSLSPAGSPFNYQSTPG